MPDVNDRLLEMFRAHGVEANLDGEWVVFPGRPYRANSEAFERGVHGNVKNIQLDVRLELGPYRTIVESSTGFGETIAAGAEEGFQAFLRQSFHVLLAAFFRDEPDAQVQRVSWTVGGRAAEATVGNFAVKGRSPLTGEQYQRLMADYHRLIEKQELSPGVHWVRFYAGHLDGKPIVFEALLDNLVCEPMQAAMAAWPWPKQADFYSVRLFLVVEVERGGDVSAETAMQWFAGVVAPREELGEDEVFEAMVDLGVPARLADRTYKFAQIAAGRRLLAGLGVNFSPDYGWFDKHGTIVETGTLAEEPSYAAAERLLPTYLGTPGFQQLALQSADVHGVNSALNSGSKPEDLVTATTFLFGDSPTEEGLAKARQTVQEHAKSRPTPPKEKKSSWKFWK